MNAQQLQSVPKEPDLRHKRQTFFQITLPLVIGSVIIVAIMVLSGINGLQGNDVVTRWSHLSLILIVIAVMIVGIIALGLLFAFIYLIARLLHLLPPYAHLIQAYFEVAALTIRIRADQLLQPLIKIKGWWAGINNFKIQKRRQNLS
jgi:hypothetical protein